MKKSKIRSSLQSRSIDGNAYTDANNSNNCQLCNNLRSEIESLQLANLMLKQYEEESKSINNSLYLQIETCNNQHTSLKTEINRLENLTTDLSKQLADRDSSITELTQQVLNKQSKVEEVQGKMDLLTEKMKDKIKKFIDNQTKSEELKSKLTNSLQEKVFYITHTIYIYIYIYI
jgi:uncharacterized coiled-coil protein SlyX